MNQRIGRIRTKSCRSLIGPKWSMASLCDVMLWTLPISLAEEKADHPHPQMKNMYTRPDSVYTHDTLHSIPLWFLLIHAASLITQLKWLATVKCQIAFFFQKMCPFQFFQCSQLHTATTQTPPYSAGRPVYSSQAQIHYEHINEQQYNISLQWIYMIQISWFFFQFLPKKQLLQFSGKILSFQQLPRNPRSLTVWGNSLCCIQQYNINKALMFLCNISCYLDHLPSKPGWSDWMTEAS